MKKRKIETVKAIFNIIDNDGDVSLLMNRKYIDLKAITEEKASELVSVGNEWTEIDNSNFAELGINKVSLLIGDKDHVSTLMTLISDNGVNLYNNPIPIPQMQGEWQGDEFIPLGYDMNHVAEYENAEANTFYNPILEIINIK